MPNPLDWLKDSAQDAVEAVVNSLCLWVWNVATTVFRAGIWLLDYLVAPNVLPSGPLSGVYPVMFGLGIVTAAVLVLIQLGRAVITGPKGYARLFMGLGQYVLVSAGFTTVVTLLVKAADTATLGILDAGLGIDSWQGISDSNTLWQNATHLSGPVAALVGAVFMLPAGLFFIVEGLVRSGAIYVLCAAAPLAAAGLVNESTSTWLWKTLRWLLALVFMTPLTAVAMVIGFKMLAGAAGGTSAGSESSAVQQVAQMGIAGSVMLLAATCPLALFKLFAFVDPNTAAGASARSMFGGSAGSDSSIADGSTSGGGVGSPGAGGASSDSATVVADRQAEQVESSWLSKAAQVSPAIGGFLGKGAETANKIGAASGGILDAGGAGHYMSTGSAGGGSGKGKSNSSTPDPMSQKTPGSDGPDSGAAPDAGLPGPGQPAPTPNLPMPAPQLTPDTGAGEPSPAGGPKPPTPGGSGGAAGSGAAEGAIGGDAAIAAVAL